MLRVLTSINNTITKALEGIMLVMFSTMVISCFLQVVTRLAESPLSWSEELSRYMAVYLTFLGACYGYRKSGLITVEIAITRLTSHKKTALLTFITSVVIAFCYVMIRYGFAIVSRFMGQTSPALHVPMGLIYAVAPICGITMLLFSIERLAMQFKSSKEA